jgi:hypothetical protein
LKKSNVPESVPGPYRSSATSGKPALTSFQFVIVLSAPQIDVNSAVVKHVAQSFDVGTTTESASIPT